METDDPHAIRREVLRRLIAELASGYIFPSDQSAPASVAGRTHGEIVHLVREFGRCPIQLGEFDEVI